MSTKNIYTAVVVMLALVMVLIVLMATGVIGGKEEETELQTFIGTRVVEVSQTDENGDVTYYTMFEEYIELGVSSDHTYKKTTKPTTTEDPFVEQDSFVYVTN